MTLNRRQLLATAGGTFFSLEALAQSWPARPVKWIVPFAAGGATDVFSRLAAERLSTSLGQPLVVENVPGAAGVIGMERLFRSAADGYTVGTIPNSLITMSPHMSQAALPYNPLTGFTPIAGIASFQYVLSVAPGSRFKSLQDLVEAARKEPGKLTAGTTGPGTGQQLAGVLLAQKTGGSFTEVAYKGASEYLTSLLGGHVDFVIDPIGGSVALIRDKKIRPLAVTGAKRSELLPEVPPMAELVPGYDHQGWFGLYGPRGLPADVVGKLQSHAMKMQDTEAFRSGLSKLGYEPMPHTPAQLQARAQAEYSQWEAILRKPAAPASK